jgi:hypothetical protein
VLGEGPFGRQRRPRRSALAPDLIRERLLDPAVPKLEFVEHELSTSFD